MKLVLVCYSGSSASILRDRMLAWARANLLDVEIIVSSLAGLDEDKEDADIVLVGPQVRCALASVRERVPERIPVMAVDTRDYGMAKGDRVMQAALDEIRQYKESIFFGLSARQFFCAVFAVAIAAGVYLLLGPVVDRKLALYRPGCSRRHGRLLHL